MAHTSGIIIQPFLLGKAWNRLDTALPGLKVVINDTQLRNHDIIKEKEAQSLPNFLIT